MKIANWNISWAGSISPKIEYLKQLVCGQPFIVILQEVKPNSYDSLKTAFQDIANIEYSLCYRAPGKYDTDSRKLGVAILSSKDIRVISARVIERSLMPDRTLVVDIEYKHRPLRIMGLHSITGCQHLKAKEIQFFSFAEAIDDLHPDIVGIDANEPAVDHFDIAQMVFFDNYNKGNGCKSFFEAMQANNLVDSYIKDYDQSSYITGKCLTTSHIIKRGKKEVRYDFLFVNPKSLGDYHCAYDYPQAVAAGSDHAAVIIETTFDI